MAMNVTTAVFAASQEHATTTDPVWQYDYGQILKFSGIDLPNSYEVHFSTSSGSGTTVTQIGGPTGVSIPDSLLEVGKYIYAYIYLHEGVTDGETEYMITIPVRQRPKPSNSTPTPVQQDAITETIAAMNAAATHTAQDAAIARTAAEAAAGYATGTAIPFDPDSPDAETGRYVVEVDPQGAGPSLYFMEVWVNNAAMMESGYIPVNKGDLIEIERNGSPVSNVCVPVYNGSKTLIGNSGNASFGGTSPNGNCYYIYQQNAAYCRIPMVTSYKDKYIVRRRSYPDLPTTNGTYALTVQITGAEPVFSWRAAS